MVQDALAANRERLEIELEGKNRVLEAERLEAHLIAFYVSLANGNEIIWNYCTISCLILLSCFSLLFFKVQQGGARAGSSSTLASLLEKLFQHLLVCTLRRRVRDGTWQEWKVNESDAWTLSSCLPQEVFHQSDTLEGLEMVGRGNNPFQSIKLTHSMHKKSTKDLMKWNVEQSWMLYPFSYLSSCTLCLRSKLQEKIEWQKFVSCTSRPHVMCGPLAVKVATCSLLTSHHHLSCLISLSFLFQTIQGNFQLHPSEFWSEQPGAPRYENEITTYVSMVRLDLTNVNKHEQIVGMILGVLRVAWRFSGWRGEERSDRERMATAIEKCKAAEEVVQDLEFEWIW